MSGLGNTLAFSNLPQNQGLGSGSNTNTNSDTLTIGPVSFLDEETPNDLEFSLNQILAIHTLIGGSKTIQALGPNMGDITWKGQLFAGNIQYRIGQLYTLQNTATPTPLTYITYSYQVLIKQFKWKFLHRWRAEYEITVSILQDTSGTYNSTPPVSEDQQINFISAAAQATIATLLTTDQAGFAAANTACNIAFLAIESAGIISQLSGPALQALIQVIENAIVAVAVYQASQASGTT
jgi:hypothetical protein